MHRFISGLSVLFHWYIFLLFWQYHTVFITVIFCSRVQSQAVWFLQLHFSCSRLLWLFGVFCVSIQIVQFFVLILWKMSFVFITDYIDSVDCFGEYGHFLTIRILILPIQKLVYLSICLISLLDWLIKMQISGPIRGFDSVSLKNCSSNRFPGDAVPVPLRSTLENHFIWNTSSSTGEIGEIGKPLE